MLGFKTVSITQENYDRLKTYGYAGESLNDALTKVLEKAEKSLTKK